MLAVSLVLVFAVTQAARSHDLTGQVLAGVGALLCAFVAGILFTRVPSTPPPMTGVKHPLQRALAWLFDPLNWLSPVRRDPIAASLDERIEQKRKLESDVYQNITDEKVPSFLFTAIGKNVDAKHDAIKTLETKAASQIGFAGTIIAIFAALGEHTHFLWIAIPLGISILASLRAIFVKEYNLPSPIVYNLDTILSDPNNAAKIASALTESYAQYGLDLGVAAGRTARYVSTGTIGLVVGVIMLLVVTTLDKGTQQPVTITCSQPTCVIVQTKGTTANGRSAKTTSTSAAAAKQQRHAAAIVQPRQQRRPDPRTHATPGKDSRKRSP